MIKSFFLSTMSKFPVEGLIFYYSFDELSGTSVYDKKRRIYGTASNTRVLGTSGKKGGCANFTLGNDHISIGSCLFLGSLLITHTLSTWIKMSTAVGLTWFIASFNDGTTLGWQVGMLNATSIYAFIRDNHASVKYLNGWTDFASYIDNEWHHFVYTADGPGNTLRMWIDGDEKSVTYLNRTTPVTFVDFQYPCVLGARNNRGTIDAYINAMIDETCMWDRLLSEDEISDLYNNGKGLFK